MSFTVAADDYDRFMGRYSVPLARVFAEFAGVSRGWSAVDIGCGPGALTAELVKRLGVAAVSAVDPSEPFLAAVRDRHPGVDVQRGSAEQLPYEDQTFDSALAQLVVHFMSDPVAGLRETARVTRTGGVVAACVWDHAGGAGPLAVFWDAARELDPDVDDESSRAGTRRGQLAELLAEAGLASIEACSLTVEVGYRGFDEWWDPFLLGVGPAGSFVAQLATDGRERLRVLCRERLPRGPFVISASAWAARGLVAQAAARQPALLSE